jgi:hypothetical protein
MKICTTCKTSKSLDDFHKNKRYKDGREYSCKSCVSLKGKKRYEHVIAINKRWYAENKDLGKIRQRNIMNRYKMTVEQYDTMLLDGCAVCGALENLVMDHDHECCPSKETCGNCIRGVLCWGHNIADGQFRSIEEVEEYLKYRKSYINR